MPFCLIPEQVTKFREALKTKELNLPDLLDPKMTSEARTAIFEKYAGDNAKAINTAFEEKLVLKNRILGLKNFASKLGGIGKYSEQGKAALAKTISEYKAAQTEMIFNPKEQEAFLNDLADKKLGYHTSLETARNVAQLTKEANDLKTKNQGQAGVSDEYLQAKQKLGQYVTSQRPVGRLASIGQNLSIIGRNSLLSRPATPLKTAIGQIINSGMDLFTRRAGALSMKGANPELVSAANHEAWQTFRKTGINTPSMESMDDLGRLGEKHNFDAPPEGSKNAGMVDTAIRKVAQVSNKIVIDWAHNIPFTKFYQKAFFDMNNIFTGKIADSEGLKGDAAKARAAVIFKDANRIEPQTKEGAIVRLEAQKQAARVTSTNNTWVSRVSLGMKDALNKITPDFPLGNILEPIAKIPANIIANGIENSGVGLFTGAKDIIQGRVKIQSTDLQTRYEGMAQFADGIQKVVRTAGALTAAAYFTHLLTSQDFRSDKYGNHFVKIGNTWINTEYFSAISPALAGMMELKADYKPGQGFGNSVQQYAKGAGSSLLNTPGADVFTGLVGATQQKTLAKGVGAYASSLFSSRGEPIFISDLLSGHPIEHLFFGKTGVQSTQEVKADDEANAKAAAASRRANKVAK